MGPKMGRRNETKFPQTQEFELGDTAAEIQTGREWRDHREGEEITEKQRKREKHQRRTECLKCDQELRQVTAKCIQRWRRGRYI